MRALTNTVERAKQALVFLALMPDYAPTNDIESIPELYRTLAAIQANLHHYDNLLAHYHQVVYARGQLIEGAPQSVNQLLTQLSRPVIRQHYRGRPSAYRQLMAAVRYLKRQGRPPCPDDIMHPVFQRRHQLFKRLHTGLFNRYAELIAHLSTTLIPDSPVFPLGQLIDIYAQIQQLTAELAEIEALIGVRYQQQVLMHQDVKMRLLAIKSRTQCLKKSQPPALNGVAPAYDSWLSPPQISNSPSVSPG